MSMHLTDEAIVEFLDGTAPAARAAAGSTHLEGCADCRRRLDTLAVFDEFVQQNRPEDDATTAAMFDVSQRLLAGSQAGRPGVGQTLRFPLLLAAVLLIGTAITFSLWRGVGAGTHGLDVRVVRYAVVETTRGTAPQRLHLQANLAAAEHVAVFARVPGGAITQLLPEGDAAAVGPGVVRLPADELLDWEFAADAQPVELLVVMSHAQPTSDMLTQLRTAWAACVPGTVPALAIADGRAARVVPVH